MAALSLRENFLLRIDDSFCAKSANPHYAHAKPRPTRIAHSQGGGVKMKELAHARAVTTSEYSRDKRNAPAPQPADEAGALESFLFA